MKDKIYNTVRLSPTYSKLLLEVVKKRKAEDAPIKFNQSVTEEAILALHKKEFK
jgi:hypothetical protein